eukprot:TRINITY_DN1072_c0_g1_i1.p1 TRINITY_DN1072_c0_g1~~TRINITY_DN1072_c0_g1_i1.p1  ORF type:complete len:103 (+),score=6.52 TRINITY_DN1072_c0_g1_i1:133-441(+)
MITSVYLLTMKHLSSWWVRAPVLRHSVLFLQERDSREAQGKNWLFFGNPHFTQDFLYQVEIQGYLKSGLLSKVDVAFSRDQAEKIYVQDKLRKKLKRMFLSG